MSDEVPEAAEIDPVPADEPAAPLEPRALEAELDRTLRRHDWLQREVGALEDRLEVQSVELDRRRDEIERLTAELEAALWTSQAPGHWTTAGGRLKGLWDNPVAVAEINRRITGSAARHPDLHFRDRHAQETPPARALGIGPVDPDGIERLVSLGLAEHLTWLDPSAERAAAVAGALSEEARATADVRQGDAWSVPPEGPVELLIVRGALQWVDDVPGWSRRLADLLAPGGLLYLDDFVGPADGVWSVGHAEVAQRLLDRLSPELRRDLLAGDGRVKTVVPARTDGAPAAGRVDELLRELSRHFEPTEIVPYGGGLALPLLGRIAGNLLGQDDLLRVIMETDALMTELGAVETAYLWSVWLAR